MNTMACQTTGVSIVCSTVCSGADQRKHQNSASLAFVMGIQRWPVDSPHKGLVTRKMFPFVDVIIIPADHGGVTIAAFVDIYPLLTFAWSLESQSCFTCVSAAEVRLHLSNMNVIISKCFDNSENEENNCMNAEIISPMTKLTITSTAFSGFIWRLVANQQGSYDNCARCYMFWT